MTYQSLIVYLDLDERNESLLRVTCDLADRFKSRVIGITAGLPNIPIHSGGMIASSALEADYEQLSKGFARCESRFRQAVKGFGDSLEWRSDAAFPTDFLATEARAADLLIVGRPENDAASLSQRSLDIGDAVMRAGRPMLVVPPRKTGLALNHILIAWKDTAQARIAVSAALPLLKRAQEVSILELVSDKQGMEAAAHGVLDVADWLQRHKIRASATAELSSQTTGSRLDAIVSEGGVDIVVAGAYGRIRPNEWAFGGVTRHLLQQSSACVLLMH